MESFKYERGTSKKGKFSRIINYANNAHSRKKVVNARDQLNGMSFPCKSCSLCPVKKWKSTNYQVG